MSHYSVSDEGAALLLKLHNVASVVDSYGRKFPENVLADKPVNAGAEMLARFGQVHDEDGAVTLSFSLFRGRTV